MSARSAQLGLLIGSTLLAGGAAQAYWAPGHVAMNDSTVKTSRPFSFKRAGQEVQSLDDYAKYQLLLELGLQRAVKAVQFKRQTSPDGEIGLGDAPTDTPNYTDTLEGWNTQGGAAEDGFASMEEAQEAKLGELGQQVRARDESVVATTVWIKRVVKVIDRSKSSPVQRGARRWVSCHG